VKDLSARLRSALEDGAWPGVLRRVSREVARTHPDTSAEVRRAGRRQQRFAGRLAADRASGRLGDLDAPSVTARLQQYDAGAAAIAAAASVDWGRGQRWVLGATDHCPDCVALAASGPYAPGLLPTAPGLGGTVCRHNCACGLEPVEGLPPPVEAFAGLLAGARLARDLDELVEVGDLELEALHARRAELRSGDRRWSQIYRSAEAELADRGLPGRWVPEGLAFGLAQADRDRLRGEALSGADVDLEASLAGLGDLAALAGAEVPEPRTVGPVRGVGWDALVGTPRAWHVVGAGLRGTIDRFVEVLTAAAGDPLVRVFVPSRPGFVRGGFFVEAPGGWLEGQDLGLGHASVILP
jgi:hypothetical protein